MSSGFKITGLKELQKNLQNFRIMLKNFLKQNLFRLMNFFQKVLYLTTPVLNHLSRWWKVVNLIYLLLKLLRTFQIVIWTNSYLKILNLIHGKIWLIVQCQNMSKNIYLANLESWCISSIHSLSLVTNSSTFFIASFIGSILMSIDISFLFFI